MIGRGRGEVWECVCCVMEGWVTLRFLFIHECIWDMYLERESGSKVAMEGVCSRSLCTCATSIVGNTMACESRICSLYGQAAIHAFV